MRDFGRPSDQLRADKSLILGDNEMQIPYLAEQGNKSEEQGN
jgi:hypothetical protein